jgi:hypothetical protein
MLQQTVLIRREGNGLMQRAGRIAFRVEGRQWVAYWALPDTMDDAIWLGAIHMALVKDEDRKRTFMALIESAVVEVFPELVEMREERAPEHERAGIA